MHNISPFIDNGSEVREIFNMLMSRELILPDCFLKLRQDFLVYSWVCHHKVDNRSNGV